MSKGERKARWMLPIPLASSELKNKKSSENPLTKPPKCGTINTKRGRTPHKPERQKAMKKATMNTILSLISTIDTPEADTVRAELNAELNRGAEQKAANAAMYDAAKPIVMEELGDSTCTIGELWDAVADKLPDGFTKGKLQYAVTRLWIGDLERVEGKVNAYKRA